VSSSTRNRDRGKQSNAEIENRVLPLAGWAASRPNYSPAGSMISLPRPAKNGRLTAKNFVFIKRRRASTLSRRSHLAGCQTNAARRLHAMTVSPDPDQIRNIVFRTFLELDICEDILDDLDERLLLDEGRYVARSYRLDDYLAMWMIDVGLIQFYDAEGNMLRTVNVFEEIEPQRMAA
jgi:hypothetical protein